MRPLHYLGDSPICTWLLWAAGLTNITYAKSTAGERSVMERRASGSPDGGDKREGKPVVIDLERLERHARDLYLIRFVEAVKAARGEFGRYLTLRTGDELAIRAAGDGSSETLDEVAVDKEPGS